MSFKQNVTKLGDSAFAVIKARTKPAAIGQTLKRVAKWLLIALIIVFVGAFLYLWKISNYPDIPNYQPISEYRFLNQSKDKVCPNPNPTNTDPNDPKNDLFLHAYQGWCDEQRQTYYRLPQGTEFFGLQYDWITALERPVGKEPLVTREYMQRLGYIYDPAKNANKNNPNDLPVGLTWHFDETGTKKILDISCAACHSGQMTYQGTSLVIDGGPGGHALPSLEPTQFIANSIVSLLTTYINPLKFNRFAKKVLVDVPEQDYRAAKKELRKDTWNTIKEALVYARYNLFLYPTEEGYGRTDGLGRIANTVYGDNISPDNYRIADAPVNYPHVWDIWAFDWVQWMGSVRQAMARNVNESLGTRAKINLRHADDLYKNTAMMSEMHCIETTLQHLEPPTWPTDLFGPIDPQLEAKGKALFKETCASCHGPFYREAVDGKVDYKATAKNHSCATCHGPLMSKTNGDLAFFEDDSQHPAVQIGEDSWLGQSPDKYSEQYQRAGYWEMIHIPLEYIGTDPTSAENMINLRYDISSVVDLIKENRAKGNLLQLPDPATLPDPKNTEFAVGLSFIGGEVRYKQYREWGLMDGYTPKPEHADAIKDLDGFGEVDNPVPWRAYRPRPLEAIWATAPFLHNGSVPSIYQLLLPADERDQEFYLGRKEFNPETLGFEVGKFKGAFKFDTALKGNSNLGHEFNDGLCGNGVIGYQIKDKPGYCRQFTEYERLALIEYLKTHNDGKRPDPESAPHCINAEWPNTRG